MLTLNDGRAELWQWDTGRILSVDTDCSQVHFSNKVFGRSIDVDVVDGAAIIPDILLQTDKDLNAWAFVGTAENGYTKISKTFKVNRRNKPADYVFTPPGQTSLEEIKERLEYLEQNPVESPVQSVNGRTGAVELNAEDVGAISAETDPTVPGWAKQPEKPTYTAAEVGAMPDTYTPPVDSTMTKSGQAADAAAVGDRLSALSEEIANAGKPTDEQIKTAVNAYLEENPVATSVTFPPIMQTAPLGQLFEAPMNYTAWCPGNLRYDKNLDKYVDLLYCNDVHVNATQKGMFVVYIDPVTFQATVPVASKYVDEDGTTEIIPTGADGIGATNFNILNDGRYCIIKDNGDGKSMFRFISSDYGITWVKSEAVTGILSTLYGTTVLSNGRWIGCDDTLNCYFYYSDDEGITWIAVKPETGGYYYEGEACILELKENVLMAVGRMSMSGVGYSASGDAEHALLSFSYDNGESWSKWAESASIDNMNASSCTGFVHDGIVEIFAASRWFHHFANAVTDYTNTGKSGAITHYVATVENALNDKFTNRGIVVYALSLIHI